MSYKSKQPCNPENYADILVKYSSPANVVHGECPIQGNPTVADEDEGNRCKGNCQHKNI